MLLITYKNAEIYIFQHENNDIFDHSQPYYSYRSFNTICGCEREFNTLSEAIEYEIKDVDYYTKDVDFEDYSPFLDYSLYTTDDF